MRIGIVGSGRIGGTVGTLWSRVGHEILFSSRHPETLDNLARDAGGSARVGTPEDAVAFGDVVLLSIPFVALPEFGRAMSAAIGAKVVLETANPYPERDGPLADEVRSSGRGTGAYLRDWFPGVRVVRAFNSVQDRLLAAEAHRAGPRIGVPLASDDEEALRVASGLVIDAGFDPVVVGGLDRAREFDYGTPVYGSGMSGLVVREALKAGLG
jgi:predicted dinucleotide-binding enzyme